MESNEPVGAVITFADVTDRIAAEAELAASEARFRNLAGLPRLAVTGWVRRRSPAEGS